MLKNIVQYLWRALSVSPTPLSEDEQRWLAAQPLPTEQSAIEVELARLNLTPWLMDAGRQRLQALNVARDRLLLGPPTNGLWFTHPKTR